MLEVFSYQLFICLFLLDWDSSLSDSFTTAPNLVCCRTKREYCFLHPLEGAIFLQDFYDRVLLH